MSTTIFIKIAMYINKQVGPDSSSRVSKKPHIVQVLDSSAEDESVRRKILCTAKATTTDQITA